MRPTVPCPACGWLPALYTLTGPTSEGDEFAWRCPVAAGCPVRHSVECAVDGCGPRWAARRPQAIAQAIVEAAQAWDQQMQREGVPS